jgi:predicted transcriptional regulator
MADTKTKQLHVIVPMNVYKTLKDVADDQRRSLSDVARDAIEDYLKTRGHDIKVTVERGGDRRADPPADD